MPERRREGTKKHGDELESLIDRAASNSPPEKRGAGAEDPAELQDDDDEDIQNDDGDERRDVGRPS